MKDLTRNLAILSLALTYAPSVLAHGQEEHASFWPLIQIMIIAFAGAYLSLFLKKQPDKKSHFTRMEYISLAASIALGVTTLFSGQPVYAFFIGYVAADILNRIYVSKGGGNIC